MLVAERDGAAVGIAGVEDCWLHGFYVRPEWWGAGVADELHDGGARGDARLCGAQAVGARGEPPRAAVLREARMARNGETRVVPYPPNPLDVGYSYVREEP